MGVSSVKVSENAVPPTNVPKTKASANVNDNSSQKLQDNFLTLLMAQMNNQDPTNPMDNSQLTSQLAQINTLSGIEKLNTTFGKVANQMGENLSMSTTNMIGRGVMVPGNKILVSSSPNKNSDGSSSTETVATPFGFELMRNADSVEVSINDASGNTVRKLDLGKESEGTKSYTWDGKSDDGKIAPDGSYSYTVSAKSNNESIPATPLSYSVVYGVIRNGADKGVLLDLGIAGTASVDDVRQIL